MPEKETLVCECGDDASHYQYMDSNNEFVVKCGKCGRFLKFVEPQEGIQHRDDYFKKQETEE